MEKEKVRTYLKEWAKRQGLTNKGIAERLGITPEGVRQQMKSPSIFSLRTLCDVLGIEPYQAFIDPLDEGKGAMTEPAVQTPEEERAKPGTVRASRSDVEKAVGVIERSLSFQRAEVSRMKTKVRIMERMVMEQRRVADKLKRTYLGE